MSVRLQLPSANPRDDVSSTASNDEVERPAAGVSSATRAQYSEARSRRANYYRSRSAPTDG